MICDIIQNRKSDQKGNKPTLLYVPNEYIMRVDYNRKKGTIGLDRKHPSFFIKGGGGISNYEVAENMLNQDLSQHKKKIIDKVDLTEEEIEALKEEGKNAVWPDTDH